MYIRRYVIYRSLYILTCLLVLLNSTAYYYSDGFVNSLIFMPFSFHQIHLAKAHSRLNPYSYIL